MTWLIAWTLIPSFPPQEIAELRFRPSAQNKRRKAGAIFFPIIYLTTHSESAILSLPVGRRQGETPKINWQEKKMIYVTSKPGMAPYATELHTLAEAKAQSKSAQQLGLDGEIRCDDLAALKLVGWTAGETDTVGYHLLDYFSAEGKYLGPDEHGVEPMVEAQSKEARPWCPLCGRHHAEGKGPAGYSCEAQ